MASKSLTFDIFGRDKTASKAIKGVGSAADGLGSKLGKLASAIGLAFAAKQIVDFGVDSVKAFAEAQQAQAKLSDAFDRFPKLADTNIKALGSLNSALAKKTKFDDDATASGQAVLAQYKLTGAQITQLTPLMQDYAAKTGKDLPTAAAVMGKALLGQGRALKDIGINFKDTGTEAGNFDQLVGALSGTVGGFAEKQGTTAAGKLEILKNRFGEVQEKIGEALIPALDDLATFTEGTLMPAVEDFASWLAETGIPAIKDFGKSISDNKDVLIPAAAAVSSLTGAAWLLNAALAANPVSLITAGIVALIGIASLVTINFDAIWAWFDDHPWAMIFLPLLGGVTGVTLAINTLTQKGPEIGAAFGKAGEAAGAFAADVGKNMLSVVGWFVSLPSQISGALADVGAIAGSAFYGVAASARGAFDGVVSAIRGMLNGVISMVNGVIGKIDGIGAAVKSATGGAVDVHVGKIPMLAKGGTALTSGMALVGERGPELLHLPKGASVIPLDRVGSTSAGANGGVNNWNISTPANPLAVAQAVWRRQNALGAV